MATSSFPFDNQDSTEDQYSRLFRELQTSGVADTRGGSALRVDASGAMGVSIQAGFALVRGHGFYSTATESLTLPAATSSTRFHLIVLQLNPTLNSIVLAIVSGVSGGSVPALTQTDTGIYEIPLACIEVGPNAVNIDPAKISDWREFLPTGVTAWDTATRPENPRLSRLGYNTQTGTWEFFTGADWKALVEPDTATRLAALENPPFTRRRNAKNAEDGTYTIQNQHSTQLDWTVSEGGSGIAYDPLTQRFTPSVPGTYRYDIKVAFNDSGGSGFGRRIVTLLRGSTLIDTDVRTPALGSFTTLHISGEVSIAAGQWLTTQVYIYAGGFLGFVSQDGYQHFNLRRVGP